MILWISHLWYLVIKYWAQYLDQVGYQKGLLGLDIIGTHQNQFWFSRGSQKEKRKSQRAGLRTVGWFFIKTDSSLRILK